MTRPGLRTILLQCALLVRRNPVAVIAAAVWLGAAGAWVALAPHLRAVHAAQQQEIAVARARLHAIENTPRVAPAAGPRQRLDAFYAALGEEEAVGEQLRRMLALAVQNGLQLNAADYRHADDATGQFRTYQISMPVEGGYQAIRQFCEQVLVTIPFASLDDVVFRRTAIANNKLEARLRFTLHIKGGQPVKGRS